MITLTKEWLQKAISQHEAMRDEIPFGLDEDDSNTLAAMRIALASLEAEPVGYVDAEYAEFLRSGHIESCSVYAEAGEGCITLYAAPPAPVAVTKKHNTDYFDTLALDTAREIMCDVNRRADFLGGDIQLISRIQCRIDEACRAAMLKAGPVTAATVPDGLASSVKCRPVILPTCALSCVRIVAIRDARKRLIRRCEVEDNSFNKMVSRALLLSWKLQFGPRVGCPACSIGFCKLCGGTGKVIQEDIDAWINPISKFMREKRDA